MRTGRLGISSVRDRIALGLIALALLLRILVPAGFMPATGHGLAITICTGMGAMPAWVDADGKVRKGKPDGAKGGQSCPFASFAAAVALPDLGGTAAMAPFPAAALVSLSALTLAIGRGLAAPPPPPTGPPATL